MAELLLINPRKRRARKASRKNPARRRARRRNPVTAKSTARRVPALFPNPRRRRSRRRNPAARVFRRRNPSMRGMFAGLVPMVKTAAIGAAGAIGVDLAMGQINKQLPDSLKVMPGKVGAGDAIKLVITVALGKLLSKPTKGMSVTAAQGALTVQAVGILKQFLPATVTSQLAYASPARIVPGSNRIGPNTLSAYTRPGSGTPLLAAYTRPGGPSPMLNSARRRESSVR